MKTFTKTANRLTIILSGVFLAAASYASSGQSSSDLAAKCDSLNDDLAVKNQLNLELQNQKIDSMIQTHTQTWENHCYIAGEGCQASKDEIDTIKALMEREMNQVQTQVTEMLQTKQQIMNGLLEEKENQIRDTLRIMDSLELKYAEMLQNQEKYGEDSLNQVQECINRLATKADSMLQVKNMVCNQYKTMVDSCLQIQRKQMDSLLAKQLEKTDSVVGIQTRARFRIMEKQQHQYKFANVVHEMVLLDSNKICIKFTLQLRDTIKLREQLRIQLKDSATDLKSALLNEIEVESIEWDASKPDLITLVPSAEISDNDLIEIIFDGEVYTNGEEISFSQALSVNIETEVALNLYPNPATDYIIPENIENITSFEIYNINGIMIKGETGQDISSISISDLPKNIYMIVIKDNNGKAYKGRFVKR